MTYDQWLQSASAYEKFAGLDTTDEEEEKKRKEESSQEDRATDWPEN